VFFRVLRSSGSSHIARLQNPIFWGRRVSMFAANLIRISCIVVSRRLRSRMST